MDLKVTEAFGVLRRMENNEEIMNTLRTEWESEKSKPFNPSQNRRQIAALLLVSPTLRNIAGYEDGLEEFDGFVERIRIALKAKLDRNPHGASLAASIANYCHPMPKEEQEPTQSDSGDRPVLYRRLDGQTTPF